MHRRDGKLIVSATDLVGFLQCGHLTNLELAAADDLVHKPTPREDPEVQLLQRRGGRHEQRYIERLEAEGRDVVKLAPDWDRPYEERAAETADLMRQGADVIYQAFVFDGTWLGFPDFLLRVGRPGELGRDHHYEVADTKLAHSAKASALLQIASYVEQVERIQGVRPEHVHVVTGGAEAVKRTFRTAEMMAYYRHAKRRFEEALAEKPAEPRWPIHRDVSYPDPVEHCAVCKWFGDHCWRQWRQDDALPLVAGIRRDQRTLLATNDVRTTQALAELERPYEFVQKRTHQDALERVVLQARLQRRSAELGSTQYELLEPEQDADGRLVADRGLSALPPPDAGDLFFDIEGDPFAFWEGLEYLFGTWQQPHGDGLWDDGYQGIWALDREEEKRAFEQVVDLFTERRREFPNMHIYHYGAYEPSHLKMLAGRHATREEELDQLLRNRVFVDLYRVVKQGVRVGAEGYSIKNLEALYGFTRDDVDLRTAGESIVEFELWLDQRERDGKSDDALLERIRLYNRDDCISTEKLRDWLEARRVEAEGQFELELPRPPAEVNQPSQEFSERQALIKALEERLTASIPEDPAEQSESDRATWLLRHLLDWHRREDKSSYWRFYDLMAHSEDDLFEDTEAIGHLKFVERIVREGKRITTDDFRYRFPPQEHKVDVNVEVHDPEAPDTETKTGTVAALDEVAGTVDIRRSKDWNGRHPEAIVPLNIYRATAQQDALIRIGTWVADNGIESSAAEWRAARDLLMGRAPRASQQAGAELANEGESGAQAALRLADQLDGTTLAIQGPPGSGKSTVGAQMIVKLVRAGRRVGVTANSHKVINNLLEKVGKETQRQGVTVRALHKTDEKGEFKDGFAKCVDSNPQIATALAGGEVDVVGGTAWLWSRDDMTGSIDTLFVDEAGQMSLANVVAMSGSARNVVLLGDPQQLEQPIQGAHPPGAATSALGHFLGQSETVDPRWGIFFEKTWRLNPAICSYTSDLFYEGRLEPKPGLEQQEVLDGPWAGAGLRWVAVPHTGNTNESPEEAAKVVGIVRDLVGRHWRNQDGEVCPITQRDVLIVSPFNAHRIAIDRLLREAGLGDVQVGTVDKFQGQEAPISIYTMATSRPEDAPRGAGFLYSLNRLNVATSRARALAIVVASPRLLGIVPATPDQLRMANGLTAFVEKGVASDA